MTINNKPEYASEYNFIVASKVDDELWFYGAYNDEEKANKTARMIDGVVIREEN